MKLQTFKDALGLSNEAAAPIHMEVGRKLTRQVFSKKLKQKDRQAKFEQLKVSAHGCGTLMEWESIGSIAHTFILQLVGGHV